MLILLVTWACNPRGQTIDQSFSFTSILKYDKVCMRYHQHVMASANPLIDIPHSSKWWRAGGMSYGCGSVPEPSASGSKNRSCLHSETRHSLKEHTFPLPALPQSSVLVLQVEENITVISEQKQNNAKIRKALDSVKSEVLDNEDRVTELQNVRLCNF